MIPEKKPTSRPPAMSVEYKLKLPSKKQKRKVSSLTKKPLRKLPHVTRILALAYHLQDLVERGVVYDYADIARLSNLTRSRITQLMNLTLLAPKIQIEILSFSRTSYVDIKEKHLRKILKTPVWQEQYELWNKTKTELK